LYFFLSPGLSHPLFSTSSPLFSLLTIHSSFFLSTLTVTGKARTEKTASLPSRAPDGKRKGEILSERTTLDAHHNGSDTVSDPLAPAAQMGEM
jgi:hypothetical protein